MEKRNYAGLDPLLGEFRNHLRITSNDLDAELLSKLKAAINTSEHEISSVIAFSTFTLDRHFAHTIKLRWPVMEVTSVKVDGTAIPAESYAHGEQYLAIAENIEGEKVEVVYKAGYTTIPDDIKAAVFLLGGSLFNNPTDRPEERDRTTARNLLRPYRRWGEHDG